MALKEIEKFLRDTAPRDFASADDFAEQLFEKISDSYQATWESERAQRVIKRTTKDIYTFYRLRDHSIFDGDDPPVRMRFGGPDTRAIRFFGKFDGFYFSKYVNNSDDQIRGFLREQYLEKGAALFGRGTPEELDDFRQAANGLLDQVNDRGVETIIRSGVQRIRNYGHINALRQARFKLMKIVAIIDRATSPICRYLDGKMIRVKAAAETVERLSKMEPGEYANELYYSDNGKAYARDPVGYVEKRITDDVLDDDLVSEGIGFPPFHPRCRTRVQGVFEK